MKKKSALSILLILASVLGLISVTRNFDPTMYRFSSFASATQQIVWQDYQAANHESGDWHEWDQINESEGTISLIANGSQVSNLNIPNNTTIVKATQSGSQTSSGHFSRTIWNLPNWEDQLYRTEMYIFLPSGFYNAMEGSVQLVGWDTYPVYQNQMRLIIYNSDKKARLFINEDLEKREITNAFTIPENQWVKVAIAQQVSDSTGWSQVYLNDQLVAEGSSSVCTGTATNCADTKANAPITRMRYGLVAIDDQGQSQPLTMYFDHVLLQVGTYTEVSNPTPTNTPTQAPDPTATPTITSTENQAPIITSSRLSTGRKNRSYSTTVKGYDPESDSISFEVQNLPPGLNAGECRTYYNRKRSREEFSCEISGKPTESGHYTVRVIVHDSRGALTINNLQLKVR